MNTVPEILQADCVGVGVGVRVGVGVIVGVGELVGVGVEVGSGHVFSAQLLKDHLV